jgi:phospholipase/lecithinase/hemolysin
MAAGGGGGLWLRWPILLGAVLVAASGGGEQSLRAAAAAPAVPALFVFGDSLIDSGNNNNLASLAKANYFPYGIDFDGGPTGRFSNGYTIVDELGTYVSVRVVSATGQTAKKFFFTFPPGIIIFNPQQRHCLFFHTLKSQLV